MTKAVQDLMVEVERVRDAFHAAVWRDADPDAALALATDDCAFTTLPARTGAAGADAVRRHLADEPVVPADLGFHRISRTGDRWRVVDEDTVSFTHDRELPWLLPGVAPTGRVAEVLVVTVVAVRRSKVTTYRALWDQVALVEQLGLEPAVLLRNGWARSPA